MPAAKLTAEQYGEAFEGIHLHGGYPSPSLSGSVNAMLDGELLALERPVFDKLAHRILELREIVRQNALVAEPEADQ